MSYLSLYRQWRPQTFEDIVGQDHIVRTLRNAILNSRVVHAYMFAGPRGTGKTSTAKVFAKALNCAEGPTVKPCGTCVSCAAVKEGNALDVIEIDAASNRGIDEIRDLRDKVRFSPAQGRYKVYIIDEVHMLTMEAFNALLKTLEEPPSHAIFILATTEANRVPSTILSRCQRFDFNRLTVRQLSEHLSKVCSGMGVEYDAEALTLIARRADGSARDALGLLEQVSASGERVTVRIIADLLGSTDFERLSGIADAIAKSDIGRLYPLVSDTLSSGTDPRQLLGELGEHFMDLLLALECAERKDLLRSGEERFEDLSKSASAFGRARLHSLVRATGLGLAEVSKAHNPALTLELFLARLLQGPAADEAATSSSVEIDRPKATAAVLAPRPDGGSKESAQKGGRKEAEAAVPEGREAASPSSGEVKQEDADASGAQDGTEQIWNKVLEQLRRTNVRIEAFARQAKPSFDGKALTLEYSPEWFFHHQKVKEDANEALIRQIVKDVAGAGIEYKCVLLKEGDAAGGQRAGKEKAPGRPSRMKEGEAKGQEAPVQTKVHNEGDGGQDEEKVKRSLEKAKALFSEVEIKIVDE